MKSLKELCRDVVPLPPMEGNDLSISGIASDSRKVQLGNLFVAISGYNSDGHNFVDAAVANGAAAVVVEEDVGEKTIPVLRVKDSRKALALLSSAFFDNPSQDLLLVGITGTNGKTTVSFLLESILKQAKIETGVFGTVTYRWKGHEEPAKLTTPDVLEIQSLLNHMRKDGTQAVVMEVSSHALALDRVYGMKFRAAVFTNLSRDHLDFHNSLKDYGKTKARLFEMLSSNGVGIINGNDSASRWMIQAAKGRTVTFGLQNSDLDYKIENVKMTEWRSEFTLTGKRKRVTLSTNLLGKFNVMNAAAAAVTGLELELDEDLIRSGIGQLQRVRGRMETMDSKRGFRVIVDYAHTPDALQNVLWAARELTKKRLIVVFGCGGERDRGKRPEMGKIAAELADKIFITSDNPRRENPEIILADIMEGIGSARDVMIVSDRKKAITNALDSAEKGDTVVVAGKGHETYQDLGFARIPFDDRSVIEDHLGLHQEA